MDRITKKRVWALIGISMYLWLFSGYALCNNVQIYKELQVTEVKSGIVTLEFGLSWDNSWRDDFNWDAVWLFLKYKEVAVDKETFWEHLYPESSGAYTDKDYVCVPGTTDGKAAGVFIFRSTVSSGRNQLTCRLKWRLPSAYSKYTKEDFDEHRIIFFVQGVEMVFLPYKAYSLGDGASRNSFCGENGSAATVVDGEDAQNLHYRLTDLEEIRSVSVGKDFPKGYRGIYMMKYELSQEQYVNFLNGLNRQQQEMLLPFVNDLQEGEYVFGRPTEVSYRNGVILARKPANGKPIRFACNLKKDERYDEVDDGKTVACNYLCPADLLAYCAWSGLRPMSELEYEKASRRLYPQEPEAGEYAWNNTEPPLFARSISSSGRRSEKPNTGSNVNAGGFLPGPVRCGSFADNARGNQQLSGGSYWGIMELSGNLRELCYNINAGFDFNGSVLGSGLFSLSLWPVDVSFFGVRGGSFLSADAGLRSSDRSEVNYYTTRDFFFRDSTVGIRGVRLAETGNVNPGKINCVEGNVVCPDLLVNIESVEPASIEGMENVPTEYMWYVEDTLIRGEGNVSLRYLIPSAGAIPRQIVIKRKAVTALGEGEVSLTLRIPDVPFNTSYQLFENPGSSIQITMSDDWKKNVKHTCWLEGAPGGLTVNGSGLVSGLTGNTLPFFKLKVAYEQCPEVVYEKDVRIARHFNYIGRVQSLVLDAGTYQMDCWGAQGGRSYLDGILKETAGKGGYAYGEVEIPEQKTVYLYIGGAGTDPVNRSQNSSGGTGGFNGGGNGGGDADNDASGGGGGATDVRLESNNLYSRIIVAGGGGGGGWDGNGGHGGGLTGGSGSVVSGGSQTSGAAIGQGGTGATAEKAGHSLTEVQGGVRNAGGGGGGGYFGGWGGPTGFRRASAGGGGSGFVSGMNGCKAVNDAGRVTNQPNHYSGLIFKNAGMQSGVRTGNGQIRIERRK